MDLVTVEWKCVKDKQKRKEPFKFPTVGEMLEYIKANKIPMDAEIVVEHLRDYYIQEGHWSHYRCGKDVDWDGISTMLPVHNGFGYIENKKYFALWMHY